MNSKILHELEGKLIEIKYEKLSDDFKELLKKQKKLQKELININYLEKEKLREKKVIELKQLECEIIEHKQYSKYHNEKEEKVLIDNYLKAKLESLLGDENGL